MEEGPDYHDCVNEQLGGNCLKAVKADLLGHVTSGFVHDLNNLLSIIMVQAGMLQVTLPKSQRSLPRRIEVR